MTVRNLVKSAMLIPENMGIYRFDPYSLMTKYYKSHDKKDLYNFLYNNPYKFENGRKKFHVYEDHKSKISFIEWMPFSFTDCHNHPHETSFIVMEGLIKEKVYLPHGNVENILFPSNSSRLTIEEYHMVQSLDFKAITLHVDIFDPIYQ